MKPYIFVLLLLFFNCKEKTPEAKKTNNEAHATQAPPEWVTYKAKDNPNGKHIVLISGDEEYRSEEALPQLAKILSQYHGFDCTVLFAQDPKEPGIVNPNYNNNIPGMEFLEKADLVILSIRFRSLPKDQMQHFENYLTKGKPLIALRTATHAFQYKDPDHPYAHYSWDYKGEQRDWHMGFGKHILGETWYVHHGKHKHQSTRGIIAPKAMEHPLVKGIENGEIWGPSDVYGVRTPLGGDAEIIVLGQTIDRSGEYDENDSLYGMRETDNAIPDAPNEMMPPLVWTKSYQLPQGKKGRSLTSTIGAATDLLDEEVRRLLVNASYYLSDLSVPDKAKVSLIGNYTPSPFKFHDDAHWKEKRLTVKDFME